MYLNLIYWL